MRPIATGRDTRDLVTMSQKIELTLQVTSPVQADELRAAWQVIVSGQKYTHAETLEHGLEGILERGQMALQVIETAIRQNPGTGQAGRLVRFLAAIYNGHDFAFDLTELRALDTRLANACLDYLNYDRLSKREVHHHLSGGDRELHQWIERYGVEPRIQLNDHDEQPARLLDLVKRTGSHPNELTREAFNTLLDKYERREFESVASQTRRAGDQPTLHYVRPSRRG